MLILGRRAEQSVVFPSCGIVVRLLDVHGRNVKLGIDAPSEVPIYRGELNEHLTFAQPPRHDGSWIPIIRERLKTIQSLYAQGLVEEAEKQLESTLLELNAFDSQFSSNSMPVSEPIPSYQHHHSPLDIRVLYVGQLEQESLDDIRFLAQSMVTLRTISSLQKMPLAEELNDFDCIIMDLDSCGREDLYLVRSHRSATAEATPCLLCLARFTPSLYGLRFTDQSVDGWMQKPIDPTELSIHIRTALGLTAEVAV
jgi:carbon storage regulator CsrA